MTDGYSWQNWDQKKSPDSREIRIIEVGLYQRTVLMVKYRPSKNQLQRWIYLHNKLICNMIKLKRWYLVDSKWYDNREKLFKSTYTARRNDKVLVNWDFNSTKFVAITFPLSCIKYEQILICPKILSEKKTRTTTTMASYIYQNNLKP